MKWRAGCYIFYLGTYKYPVLADDKSHKVLKAFRAEEIFRRNKSLQHKIIDMRLAKNIRD